ncbi:prolyl oligopeptidase family serine peptidase [Sinomicrobium soli]|uniref:prolyl oligopeptidase family serine peptidase n=1 Tax=Sinomicrobium sp. N-1-3-6 TaxID=2219864 RepID=UPI000DCECE32|nr:prolyl oligopeptidase family serine peptidase [Sinomicrobium sp. N-1-3-6]RAV28566.1 S9 family peptidase [Sinomicrobium sp. N-1-3-6]
MKKTAILALVTPLLWYSCGKKEDHMKINYPETKKTDTTDVYFGAEVRDPYRWLEDDRSAETAAWVAEENKVTQKYLEQIPFRKQLKERLQELWNYERLSSPFREGDYTYYSKNDGLQDQSVIYRKNDEGSEEMFLDPNTFSKDGTVSLGGLSFTKDGKLLAYSISEGGSDWRKVIVMDAQTREILEDTLTDIKFSGMAWKGNEGFFYSSYDKPEGSELSAKTDQHKLYFHKLGTSQKEDEVIFGDTPGQKHRYVFAGLTEDERYLTISASNSTSGNKLFVKDLGTPGSEIITILDHTDSDTGILDSRGDTLYLVTNLDAPNQKVVTATIASPGPEHWADLIPETENVLNVSTGGGYLFAKYMVDAISKVYQYDYKGQQVREIALPGVGTSGGFFGKEDQEVLYYSFTNYNTPGRIYSYEVNDGVSDLYWKPEINFSPDNYMSEQVFYNSKDGTRIPMIITYKKGTELNGKNPTILYGYGGFNISLQPSFSTVNAIWLEQGGIYAVPNLRGGGEYGKKWHDAGTKMQKQNVFDDFIAAAEYLIDNQYTSSQYLAIKGGSNGGLLVGATMTQRPDLMKVALPAVGVLDMLRYHKFTAGAGWAYDYGTSEDNEEMFRYLLGYSPLHNIANDTVYPSTLITTADHDDRVVPAHSFKFAATLQEKHSGENPVLIRIETDAGHGAGTPISKTIEQTADVFGFTLYEMGYRTLPVQAGNQSAEK